MARMNAGAALREPSFFPEFCPVTDAVGAMANAGIEARGAIFTKREVVDFILDLVGYTVDKPLHRHRLLEPSFGGGDFLLPAVDRLLKAWTASGAPATALTSSIRAVELHCASYDETFALVLRRLNDAGISGTDARSIVDEWLVQGDFLLAPLDGEFDAVIGNPPYVRQELIADVLMAEYRSRYKTIYDRADIYIPFIERSLNLLAPNGQLSFICSDRWMKNRYGGPLRPNGRRGFSPQGLYRHGRYTGVSCRGRRLPGNHSYRP